MKSEGGMTNDETWRVRVVKSFGHQVIEVVEFVKFVIRHSFRCLYVTPGGRGTKGLFAVVHLGDVVDGVGFQRVAELVAGVVDEDVVEGGGLDGEAGEGDVVVAGEIEECGGGFGAVVGGETEDVVLGFDTGDVGEFFEGLLEPGGDG